MKPSLENIFKSVFPDEQIELINKITDKWIKQETYRDALCIITEIEKEWGPIGIWSASYEKHKYSFHYPKDYDSIFRPLKYTYMDLYTQNPEIPRVTRDIVESSTMHIEGCLKIFCKRNGLINYARKWIVPLVNMCSNFLDDELKDSLKQIGKGLSNPAKHVYDVGTNESLFSASDAICTYLCCRKLGYVILLKCGEITDIIKACQTGPFLGIDIFIPGPE